MPFTDLHSHILPGFDDGAGNTREFLEMAKVAVQGGTVNMAATPHYDLESPGMQLKEVAAAGDYTFVADASRVPLLLSSASSGFCGGIAHATD